MSRKFRLPRKFYETQCCPVSRTRVHHFFSRPRPWALALLAGALGLLGAVGPARAAEELPVDSRITDPLLTDKLADAVVPERSELDLLVYKNGDRLRGRLAERSETELVFVSERFGRLRVPVAEAKVILANGEEDAAAAARARTEEAEGPFSVWSLFSVRALTSEVRNFFGPWQGRFVVSTQVVSDTTERTNFMAEAHLRRKWQRDNVKLGARYDFSETNHLATTDVFRAEVAWRHDFPGRLFSLYSPSLEWNRAYAVAGVPADYVLLQQEVGAGVSLFSSPHRHLRVGLAENVFDLWQTIPPESHNSKMAESVFLETDLKLPWQMTLTERGVWYYSLNTGRDGWENKLELDKQLSETFTVGIRHEVRYNNPGVRVQDYTLLKLLLGLDF